MVKKENFRVGCLVVGFIGLIGIMISDGEKLLKAVGIIVCILLMIFGYVSTGKFGKFIIGEEVQGKEGSMG